MKKLLIAAVIAAVALASGAPAASAATREYEGTVVSVDRGSRTLPAPRLRARHDPRQGHEQHALRARHRFAALRAGQRNIETTVRRSNGRWVALEVERSGGGGSHGDDDDHDDD